MYLFSWVQVCWVPETGLLKQPCGCRDKRAKEGAATLIQAAERGRAVRAAFRPKCASLASFPLPSTPQARPDPLAGQTFSPADQRRCGAARAQ